MSCYTRHLAELLPADPSAADKRALDRAVRKELGMETADCPEVWEEVKTRRTDPYFASKVTTGAAAEASRTRGSQGAN